MPTSSGLFGGGAVANVLGTTGTQRPRQRLQQQDTQQTQPMGTAAPTGYSRTPPASATGTQSAPQVQTFAQMQQAGVARPAPPMAQPVQQYFGSQQGNMARSQLAQQVQQAVAQPTRYDTAAYQQMRNASAGNIQADYDRQRTQLDEEMARRGLYDSTYAARGFQDLGGQQARALASMESDLLRDGAQTQMSDRLGAANMTGTLAQLAGSQDLAQFEANRVGQAMDFENQMRSSEFGEGTRQFDLQQQLAQQLGLGGLGLESQRLAQQGQQFGQSIQLSRDELALRGDLGQQEQELARQRMTQDGTIAQAQLNLENARLGQQGSQFDQRLAQEGSQFGQQFGENSRQFDLQQQLAQFLGIGNLGLDQQRLDQQGSQFDQRLAQEGSQFGQQFGEGQRQFDTQTQQTDLARMLQERLGLGAMTGTINGQNTVERDRLNVDADLARQDMLGRLLSMLGLNGIQGILGGTGGTGGGSNPYRPSPPTLPEEDDGTGTIPPPSGGPGYTPGTGQPRQAPPPPPGMNPDLWDRITPFLPAGWTPSMSWQQRVTLMGGN